LIRRLFPVVVLLLALGACTEAPMSRAEGREFAERSLRSASVDIDGRTETASKDCGRSGLPGWSTTVSAEDGSSIEVCVYRRGDRAAFVRDVGPAGVGPLLTDEQFRRLEAFRYDPVGERRNRVQNQLSLVAALLLAAVVAALVISRRRPLLSARSS
jgi:hypothetical protein